MTVERRSAARRAADRRPPSTRQLLQLRLAAWLLSGSTTPAVLEHRGEPDTPGVVLVGIAQQLQELADQLTVLQLQLDRELGHLPDRVVARLPPQRGGW